MNTDSSKYTITIFELLENNFDFGLNDYEIWNEAYRPLLNNAILNNYMFREIGFFNPNEFKFRLKSRMNLIMRNKYNALYIAKSKEFNPLYTMEMYEEYEHSIVNSGTTVNNGENNINNTATTNVTNTDNGTASVENNGTTNSDSLGLHSIFPSDEMINGDVDSNEFIDQAQKGTANEKTKNTTNQSNSNTITTVGNNVNLDKITTNTKGEINNDMTEKYNKKTYGSASDLSFAHAMTQFKDYCDQFDLDNQVIKELRDLFMNIW